MKKNDISELSHEPHKITHIKIPKKYRKKKHQFLKIGKKHPNQKHQFLGLSKQFSLSYGLIQGFCFKNF